MKRIKWGVLSTGTIAQKFAGTLLSMGDEAEACAVASRRLQNAEAFAQKYAIPKAYGSYEELVKDAEVDAVYVATPHAMHYENMMLCLAHGKHVLCEKSFTANAAQAREVYGCAKEKGLFVMEAFWTRFLPIYRDVENLIADGRIGEIRLVTAQYGYKTDEARAVRKMAPELAGGTLLDIGVYAVGFASMILGYRPLSVQTAVSLNALGTDNYSGILLEYEGGRIAQLTTAIQTVIPVVGCIYGSEGYISLKDFKSPQAFDVVLNDGSAYTIEKPFEINGFEYEIREAQRCISEGRTGSDLFTPEQSVAVMGIMDRVRDMWRMKFPFE